MKKLILLTITIILGIYIHLSYLTNINKNNLVSLLDYYARVIEKDLLLEKEINHLTYQLISKYEIIYQIEKKESDYIKFSLSSYYFSYLSNEDINLSLSYLITW